MPDPTVDARTIVTTLIKNNVRFVVVGGFAVELWGVAVPPTVDIDITPEMSSQNLRNLAAALNQLDAGIRSGSETIRVPGGFTAEKIAEMKVLNLQTSAGPLDLTILPAGTSGYDDLVEHSSEIEFDGVMVPTASLRDVARSKEAAGRAKDLRMLPAIHDHLAREERLAR